MPPIIEDYADIKRRMDALGRPALSRGDGEIIEYIVDGWVWRDLVTPEGRVGLGKNRPMAQGGIVPKGTPYIVGERAPEAFVPTFSGPITGEVYWELVELVEPDSDGVWRFTVGNGGSSE